MEYLSMTQGEYLNAIFRHDFVGAFGEEKVFVFWVNQERRRWYCTRIDMFLRLNLEDPALVLKG
jgi:hypothetical protein